MTRRSLSRRKLDMLELGDERALSREELEHKYAPQHPVFWQTDWRDDVINQETIQGYWQWLESKVRNFWQEQDPK